MSALLQKESSSRALNEAVKMSVVYRRNAPRPRLRSRSRSRSRSFRRRRNSQVIVTTDIIQKPDPPAPKQGENDIDETETTFDLTDHTSSSGQDLDSSSNTDIGSRKSRSSLSAVTDDESCVIIGRVINSHKLRQKTLRISAEEDRRKRLIDSPVRRRLEEAILYKALESSCSDLGGTSVTVKLCPELREKARRISGNPHRRTTEKRSNRTKKDSLKSNNSNRFSYATRSNSLKFLGLDEATKAKKRRSRSVPANDRDDYNAGRLAQKSLKQLQHHRASIAEMRPQRRKVRWHCNLKSDLAQTPNHIQDLTLDDLATYGGGGTTTISATMRVARRRLSLDIRDSGVANLILDPL